MLRIENACLTMKKRELLKNVNLEFASGRIYNLTGVNGSGKTILLRVLAGLIRLSSGNISYNKIPFKSNFLPDCGIIIEKHQFIGGLTGFENLKILADIKCKITDNDIIKYMHYFGLDETDRRKVSTYSLGMRQKLSIIQAVMEDPKVLLLDEPTNALDEQTIEKFKNLMKELKKQGKIIIIATHDKTMLGDLADYHISVSEGICTLIE